MLRIPENIDLATEFARDLADECMSSAEERSGIYVKAAQYYYTGTGTVEGAIHNKTRGFIDRLAGYYYQPSNVRFSLVFDSSEPQEVLDRARSVGQMLTADFRSSDADLRFSDCVTWSLICGCYLLKHYGQGYGFKAVPLHPINFGVLSEAISDLNEQEAFCHVSYPTVTRLRSMLREYEHPDAEKIYKKILETHSSERDQDEPNYYHQMVVGGMRPVGEPNMTPSAAGIVQVFPVPSPWRPQRKISQTVKLCELWVRDEKRDGDWTTMQLVYPDVLIEGGNTRRNLSGIPGHQPFVKVIADETPGYFWGRTKVADVQMLQDLVNKRLRDIKIMWDRNTNAPQMLSGFQGLTEESYYKIMQEGGFISDPNPNAKAQKLVDPPPQGYLEELEFLWQMFDEAGGFSKIMTGQGESGVRAGVHAQTLVRTSSPALIDPATRVERCLADSGYLCTRLMQDRDPHIYKTDSGQEFLLSQLPEPFQVEVDSHSASPAFAEDSRQIAIALARAQAIDAEDLIRMLHPPGEEIILARLRQRQAKQAQAVQAEHAKMIAAGINPEQPGRQRGRRPTAQ